MHIIIITTKSETIRNKMLSLLIIKNFIVRLLNSSWAVRPYKYDISLTNCVNVFQLESESSSSVNRR